MVEEKKRRGTLNSVANRMICTSTVRGLQKKLAEKNVNVSTGIILQLKPFFITYASDKELSLCLCKLCLNVKFLFDTLMAKAKKDGDEGFISISNFFMYHCECPRTPNSYFKWSCVTRTCSQWRNLSPATLTCEHSTELVTVNQIEVVQKQYMCFNKQTNEFETKSTKNNRSSAKIN